MLKLDLSDFDGLVAAWEHEVDAVLMPNLAEAVKATSEAGAHEAQANHPYTDRTRDLTKSIHAEPARISGRNVDGAIVADEYYASFVNNGTSRSKPYPFMPIAERKANDVIEENTERACDRFCDTVNRGG